MKTRMKDVLKNAMNNSTEGELRKMVKKGKTDNECITFICSSYDMHAEDAEKIFAHFVKVNYDEQGNWTGKEC